MRRDIPGVSLSILLAIAACSEDEKSRQCMPACAPCQTCDTSGRTPACVNACGAGATCQDGRCVATPSAKCAPACNACQMCDTSGASPVCVDACGPGVVCQDGKCVAAPSGKCAPTCGPCQSCDTSGATPVCKDHCASGLTCEDGKCIAPSVAKCAPACGPCQVCDTSGATPVCKENCAPGLECNAGACVLPADPCNGACAPCQRCDTAHGVPACVDACPDGTTCDTAAKLCRPTSATSFDHSGLAALQGPFATDLAGSKSVTSTCLSCHPNAGQQMLATAHWKWLGSTPNLTGGKPSGTVGKKNLVNNFCVAVPSNEKRCSQCHAGYGYGDKNFDFNDKSAIDCLVCHATHPGYKKDTKLAGLPEVGVDMAAAAKSVGRPTRASCGRCHFAAGGGDNVKKGDLGSALSNPAAAADVHMGAANSPFSCVSCHKGSVHKIPGQGVHLPVSEGRIGCADCHGEAPHGNAQLNNHALDLACQTCHVPAFSRQQPTKMNWDWSTAGNRTRGTNGLEEAVVDGKTVPVYDAMKGDFVWKGKVRPSYAWYDGRMTRMTLDDTYPAGRGSQASPINLGGPVATKNDAAAKIFPFKVMRGRQPVDTTTRKVLSPQLFGPGGFWATIPAATAYTPELVENNWTNALTAGARYAGQIGATESFSGRAIGAKPWDWAYTEMWMGINHEVAPKAATLSCGSCHGAPAAEWSWTALGYSCDPMSNPAGCGSRHK